MRRKLGNAGFTLAQGVGNAGAFDGQRRAIGNRAQQFAFAGEPFIRSREANSENADDFLLNLQGNSPERFGFLTHQGIQQPIGMVQIGQHGRFARLRNAAGKSAAERDQEFRINGLIEASRSRRAKRIAAWFPQQKHSDGSVKGLLRDLQYTTQEGGEVLRGEFRFQGRKQGCGSISLRIEVRAGNRNKGRGVERFQRGNRLRTRHRR